MMELEFTSYSIPCVLPPLGEKERGLGLFKSTYCHAQTESIA